MYRLVFVILGFSGVLSSQVEKRWDLIAHNQGIEWIIEGSSLPHTDNIEMSGKRVSTIIEYTVDTLSQLSLKRTIIYPQYHPLIKETDPWWQKYRAYATATYSDQDLAKIYVNGKQFVPGKLKKVIINGVLTFIHEESVSGITLSRKLYPSTDKSAIIEYWKLTNNTQKTATLIPKMMSQFTNAIGEDGDFGTRVKTNFLSDSMATIYLEPSESFDFSFDYEAFEPVKDVDVSNNLDAKKELQKRKEFLNLMSSNLVLETPDATLNQLFEFSKIRASESIFDSKLGVIHSPGGGRYYVGIWANDQAEYVSPFFPYLGYDLGNESALNTYRAFDKVKSPDYKAIQYAFEVETLKPPSQLDRGDAAMIAYGASQYAIARGNITEAKEIWPLIEWCLQYNHLNLNDDGVVNSESDEMEGRIETGDANLSTSSLYYGGLQNAIYLGKALGKDENILNSYSKRLDKLGIAIENYFGTTVEGIDTYKYYKEHTYLRHWICLPLVVDITTRSEATTGALFHRLWTDNGVHVEKNSDNPDISKIFWDRGTLYALRGTFRSGATDQSLERLQQFSQKRLLSNRVPYVVEAFPEGNKAHLSAESGLYCRVFTEGLFAITPTSFRSFKMQPRLPSTWDIMALRHIRLFDRDFDIEVTRVKKKRRIKIYDHQTKKELLNKKYDLNEVVFFNFN